MYITNCFYICALQFFVFGAKFHQNAKEQCGWGCNRSFFEEIFEKHSPKFRVSGRGLPDLECLLLQIAKQQTDYKLF
jgi:hypothetical protein